MSAVVVGVLEVAVRYALFAYFVHHQPVECGFEVVEDNGVGEAFEDEGKLPKGVEAVAVGGARGGC